MMERLAFLAGIAVIAVAISSPVAAQRSVDTMIPEGASGESAHELTQGERHMVAAANPLAVQAGLDVLRAGGSAADALVAVQAVLGLVEPQSSGIGGGGFLLWYDGETGELTSFDARETAPATATGDLFLDEDGEPLEFFDAVIGGRSVGVPGMPRLMEVIHERAGRLGWADLFDPAIELAREGFAVSPRLNALIADDAGRLDGQEAARDYFYGEDGTALKTGSLLVNEAYAATLQGIAEGGAAAFYRGEIAGRIVETVSRHATNPGELTLEDMAAYEVIEREPVCIVYREHDVCGMGPPSSGGLTVAQTLGMLSGFDLAALGPDDPQSWRLIGDASRLAFADRGLYMADSDFVDMPEGLLDPDYLAERASLLAGREDGLPEESARPGEPPWDDAGLRLPGLDSEQPATTHIVIADDAGNVASLTSSIENAFGSRLMVDGFLLNNQLTDFSFLSEEDGEAVANRVEGGKRPRSSMAPTIILRDGEPVHALGSPGGVFIIPYVAKAIIGLMDWDMDMQEAIDRPHLVNAFGPYLLEAGTPAEEMAGPLDAMGYEIEIRDLNSGLHGISLVDGVFQGGADPRREGVALGD